MEEFIVPPIEEAKPLPTPKEASEQAFYAAAASKENPIEDYMKIKMDLESTGDSEFINNVKSQWDKESNDHNRQAIEGIIGDTSINHEVKKAVLRSYSLNGFIPSTLKERYIQKTAASDDLNDTVHQQKAQDWVVANLQNRRAQMDIERREHDISNNATYLQSFLGSVSHLYEGVGNTLGLVSDEEYKAGHEEYKKLSKANPISAGVGQAVGLIGGALPAAFFGGPAVAIAGTAAVGGALQGASKFAELGQENVNAEDRLNASMASAGMTSADFALPIFRAANLLKGMILNGAGAVAIGELDTNIQNRILEAYPELRQEQLDAKNMTVNGVFGALIGAVFGRRGTAVPKEFESKIPAKGETNADPLADVEVAEKKVKPHFKMKSDYVRQAARTIEPGSPADVTATANPKVAEVLGTAALKEPSGVIAEALGTTKGSIVNDWVLPKIEHDITERINPDLSRSIKSLDDNMEQLFHDLRYDPNIVNATKRDDDAARIYEAANEIKGMHYQQSNSTTNFTDFISEGKMVFGPNPTSGFLSLADAQAALKNLEAHINKLPEDERGTLGVVRKGFNSNKTAETKNTFVYDKSDSRFGRTMGKPQPKGTPTDKLFSNFADHIKTPAAQEEFRSKMFDRANNSPKAFEKDKVETTVQPFKDNLSAKIDAAEKGYTRVQIIDNNNNVVAAARVEKGMIDSIAVDSKYKGKEIGENLLAFLDRKGIANIHEVPDRSPGFVAIQKKVLSNPNKYSFAEDEYRITWDWKKEYDDASISTFGPDSINSSILGVNASALARSSLGNWLFHTGRFPDSVERGAMRAIERGTRVEDAFIKAFEENVAKTPHGKELNHLIDEAEGLGKEHFTKAEISSYFPHLGKNQVDKLYETHTYWRRMQHYFYAFMNREYRHRLVNDGHQGIYNKEGDYLGPVSTKVTPKDYDGIKEIWSFYHERPVKFDPKEIEQNASQIVRLGNKVEDDGNVFEFGLVEGDLKLDMLPTEVLPRVPGYSPRLVKENFFVDVIPNKMTVNGVEIKDPKLLTNYARTVGAAKTEREANALIEQAQANHPEWGVKVRPDRTNTFGRVVTDYQVHTEMFRQSKKRGERVPSSTGEARIEDRLVTSIKMAQNLSRMGAFREWENTFRAAFTKGFGDFLEKGEFPQYKTDIRPLKNMSKEDNVKFQTAQRLFEFYSKQKNFETLGDHLWKSHLHNIADVLEKWKIPAETLRKIGKRGNLPVKYSKMAATAAYIHLNPIRQWVIQPAQLMEMYAINPHTALPMFKEMLAIRLALSGEANLLKPFSDTITKMSRSTSSLSPEEFNETIKSIRESGLLQSIDTNVLVHGMFKEVDRNLIENTPEKVAKDIESIAKAPLRASRAVGFDAAELTNRIGLYLQAKELWKQQNPGKKWNTKENKEVIAAEALRLSGLMNKSGNLPYQEGTLSVFFQFAAISQKLMMNMLQDNATIMTPLQRARLAAVRATLYGAKYGIPGGAAAYYFIEQSEDPEIKANAEMVKRGLVDYTANNLIATLIDPDTPSNLAISKSLTPYSEGFLPYYDFLAETVKLVDNKPSSNPRYPAFSLASSFGKAVDQMQGWFLTREVNGQGFTEAALEAAELASGFNNYSQGLLLLGMRDKVTSNGNKLGEQYSLAEAYGKMFLGSQSQKEIDTYELLSIMGDKAAGKKEMAKEIHQGLMNIRGKIGEQEADIYAQRLSSFMSLLSERHFSQEDRIDVINQVLELDRRSYTTLRQSVLADVWKHHSDKQTTENMKMVDILKRSQDPRTQEFVKLLEEGKL